MKRVVDSQMVSTMRKRLARSEEPVSVTSTMASTRPGIRAFTSVVPQENSTSAWTPRPAKKRLVPSTNSVAMRLPCRSSTFWTDDSSGTAITQRTGRELALL